MRFQVDKKQDVTFVEVDAQLIVTNRTEFKETVLARIEEGDRIFLIDFSGTSYIDSSGLGVLVSLARRIHELGGRFRLAGLNDDLRILFELTKLDSIFRIHDSPEEALRGIRAP